jgi:hypothetical protein
MQKDKEFQLKLWLRGDTHEKDNWPINTININYLPHRKLWAIWPGVGKRQI